MKTRTGTHIVDFLTERCAALTAEHAALSLQVQVALPTVGEMPQFISRLSTVREQLPRCEELLAALLPALANGDEPVAIVEQAIAAISESMEPLYCDGQIEMSEAADCALAALRELFGELSTFSPEADLVPAKLQFPDPRGALVASRMADADE